VTDGDRQLQRPVGQLVQRASVAVVPQEENPQVFSDNLSKAIEGCLRQTSSGVGAERTERGLGRRVESKSLESCGLRLSCLANVLLFTCKRLLGGPEGGEVLQ